MTEQKIKQPDPIDVHVGGRVRLRRTLMGMSQDKLGKGLGLTFQQIQKYERGANRMGSSRLYRMSQILQVPITFFFEGLDQPAAAPMDEQLTRRETLELVRSYYQIQDPSVRKKMFELIKAMAKSTAFIGIDMAAE